MIPPLRPADIPPGDFPPHLPAPHNAPPVPVPHDPPALGGDSTLRILTEMGSSLVIDLIGG